MTAALGSDEVRRARQRPGELALLAPASRRSPYEVYDELRAECPVQRGRTGYWLVTGFDAVNQVLRDPSFVASRPPLDLGPSAPFPEALDAIHRNWLLFTDPPAHRPLRAQQFELFSPAAVEAWRPRVRAWLAEELGRRAAGVPFDVVGEVCVPLTSLVAHEVLGVPAAAAPALSEWSKAITRALDPLRRRRNVAEAEDAARRVLDFGAALCPAGLDEGPSDDEGVVRVVANAAFLYGAATITTASLLSSALLAVLSLPSATRRGLGRRRRLPPELVDELVRIDPPVQAIARRATAHALLEGRHIAPGDKLLLFLGAANRDPTRYDNPDVVSPDRPRQPNASFGFGLHHCVGARLARMELEEVVIALVRRSPTARVVERPSPRAGGLNNRGYDHMTIVL